MTQRILIVDDDAHVLKQCIEVTNTDDYQIDYVSEPSQAMRRLRDLAYAIIFVDISFSPGGREGVELVSQVKDISPKSHIIMMTSYSDQKMILKCLESGANDYFVKDSKTYSVLLKRIRAVFQRSNQQRLFEEKGQRLASTVGAIYKSEAMKSVFKRVAMARENPSMHVLITGPTGAGKEVVARAMSRAEQGAPYFPFNCSNFVQDLFESELFGHERGAFTGADKRKIGLLEQASSGDIFLDEVARLTLSHQAKLLRAVQSGEFLRLGGSDILHSHARIIAATNEDLAEMVLQGAYRKDLLYRLNQFTIEIPALSKRREDIEPLLNHFISTSQKNNLVFSKDALSILQSYSWPGNVRQLRNVVARCVLHSSGEEITIGELPKEVFQTSAPECDERTYRHKVELGTSLEVAVDHFKAGYLRKVALEMKDPTLRSMANRLSTSHASIGRSLKKYGISLPREYRS